MPLIFDIQLHPVFTQRISNSANTLSAPAPCLRNGSDTAPVVIMLQTGNALPQPCAAEHNTQQAYETDRRMA